MLIDMHNHTNVSSPCSLLTPEQLIENARERGLDAICVTEHMYIEGANVVQEIGRQMGFAVFRGVEARTELGDMLVYGYYQDIPEGIPLDELVWYVHEVGGVVFAAHPYYAAGGANLYAAMQARGLDLDTDWDKIEALRELDGVELVNGQVPAGTNAKANLLAARLGRLPGIAGSDAHAVDMIARAATYFEHNIETEDELVTSLKSGAYWPIRLRY